ncbi:hypothetical protein LDENG_00235300 [Lucifuga dentata]|nr:hypothetical protein LDENG_00235300 [Lucifuga dentata]
MFFLPSRPPLVSVHSAIKINLLISNFKGPYHPFCMFEPNIFSFHVTLLTIISQRIKPYFSFPDILLNLLIFQNQIFK